jgi:hypothetical protein
MTAPTAIMETRIGNALNPELWTAMMQGSPSGYRKTLSLLAVSLLRLKEPGESGRVE